MIRSLLIYIAVLFVGILFFISMILFVIPAIQESTLVLPSLNKTQSAPEGVDSQKEKLEKEIGQLQTKLDKYTPSNAYVIIKIGRASCRVRVC